MLRSALITTALTAAAVALASPATAANASVVIDTNVTVARQLSCGDDNTATWEVEADVDVLNPGTEPQTFTMTDFDVKFRHGDQPEVFQPQVEVVDDGGFSTGSTVAPGASNRYHTVVRAEIPCDASDATFLASLKVGGDRRTYASGDFFLEEGTPVPLGMLGGIGAAVLAALAALATSRRRPVAPATVAAGGGRASRR